MAAEYSKHFGNVTRRATVPEVVAQILASRKQDGSGKRHLAQLRSVLNRFATAHPGQILDITSSDIDAWLRGLNVSPSSRNSMLLYVNILFSFALEQNYLPEGKPIASSQLRKVKVKIDPSMSSTSKPSRFHRTSSSATDPQNCRPHLPRGKYKRRNCKGFPPPCPGCPPVFC